MPAIRLDEDGYLWEALEEDPSADRESSVPFKLIPYAGGCTYDWCTRKGAADERHVTSALQGLVAGAEGRLGVSGMRKDAAAGVGLAAPRVKLRRVVLRAWCG